MAEWVQLIASGVVAAGLTAMLLAKARARQAARAPVKVRVRR